jgi:hypothetical protein
MKARSCGKRDYYRRDRISPGNSIRRHVSPQALRDKVRRLLMQQEHQPFFDATAELILLERLGA